MFPALMAARPLIKYGILIGVPVLILICSHWYAYSSGDENGADRVQSKWNASIQKQAEEAVQQTVKADAMEAQVYQQKEEAGRVIEEKAKAIKRKVADHAKATPAIPLSPEFVRMYDELRQLPNEAGRHLPTDPGTSGPEVSSGEVRSATPQLVQVEGEDGEIVELTTDELYQAVTDAFEKLAEVKKDYKGFSDWNDGRERIELERVKP